MENIGRGSSSTFGDFGGRCRTSRLQDHRVQEYRSGFKMSGFKMSIEIKASKSPVVKFDILKQKM
jgi:hypothetical protein